MFAFLPVLAALIPTINYGVTRAIDHFTGGPKPSNAQEAIALKQADIAQLEALSKLDNADGAPSWVIAIRALQRPFAVLVILGVWAASAYKYGIASEDLMNLAEAAVFYLFGDRTTMALTKGKSR